MDRVEKSQEKFKQLFGEGVTAAHATDPDFQDILSHFIFGENQVYKTRYYENITM